MMQPTLTVVQALPALESGGVERGTIEVANELVKRGHRSIVVSAGGRMVGELETGGSEHVRLHIGAKSLQLLGAIRPLRTFLLRERPDILHLRSRLPAWTARFALRGLPPEARPVVVTTVHGLYSVSRYSAIMTRADAVIAVSKTVRQYLAEHYPALDPSAVHIIPRGVDEAEFPHGYRPDEEWTTRWFDEYPMLRGARVLTLPGRLSRGKGHTAFIELLARLNNRTPPVWGLIVGGEDPKHRAYVTELRKLAQARGASVHFTGHRADMRQVYAASDIVLSLSSKPESFGRTVLEALSMGVPVVGFDHGGVGEVLGAIWPEGLVPPGDLDALVQTVERVLASRPTVPRQNRYRKAEMLDATIRLYEDLAAHRSFKKSPQSTQRTQRGVSRANEG